MGGRAPLDNPPVAAALTALEMLGPDGDAERLSAWLRSPFMQGHEPEALGNAARSELEDRDQVHGQLPLTGRRAPLIKMLAELAPTAANRLEAAWQLSAQAGDRAVPSTWIAIWQAQLAALGWLDEDKAARNSAVQALEQGFDALSSLAPMLKAIGPRRALEELRNVLNEPLIGSPLPVKGLHVLTDPSDLGPGYAAAWGHRRE